MPYATSEQDIARHHKQVLLVGNCGPGAWHNWVFTRGDKWNESGDPTNYGRAECGLQRVPYLGRDLGPGQPVAADGQGCLHAPILPGAGQVVSLI